MAKFWIIILFLISPKTVFSQESKPSEIITSIAEELAADENDPGAAEMFIDRLFELSADPVRINTGEEDEISRLFFLTGFQVRILADYVRTTGSIESPFEIANLPGFDKEITEMMVPFITFENSLLFRTETVSIRHTLLSNFIIKSPATGSESPGSPWKILTKYKLLAGSFSGGITIEKDPGERFLYGDPPVPDFLSAFMAWQGTGFVKKIVIGDYSLRFGQGTAINTGIRTSISLTNPGYLAGKNEIRPYTSTDENNFFRGAAAELSLKNLYISLFFSSNKIDATLNDSGSSISSLYKTGLHDTPVSILKKDAVGEICYGLHLSYNFSNLRTGILWSGNRFSLPFVSENTNPYCINNFKGDKNSLCTIYYNCIFNRFIFFGEFSTSGSKRNVLVQGISMRPDDRLNINLIYRHYSAGFTSFHGNGPNGNLVNNNESGIFGNITFEAAKFIFISAGSEIRYFPWLRYRCSAPSTGRKNEIRIRYLPSDRLSFETLYDYRYSIYDKASESGIPGQDEMITQSVRGYLKYSLSDNIVFGIRLDYKAVNPSGSKGMLLLQDMSIRLKRKPVSIWVRYCIFNTGGFESALYTWENDLLNSFSIPAMYGSGSRCYIMASWKLFKKVEIRFKYAITEKEAAANALNNASEFKIQFKIDI